MHNQQQQHRPTVLLVEDDDRLVDVFVEHLSRADIDLVVAKSKTAAEALIGGEYQLAVCDLQIPTSDGSLDAAADHGISILEQLRAARPGMPVLVFSGCTPTQPRFVAAAAGLRRFNKSQLPECLTAIKTIVEIGDTRRT